MTKKLLNLNLAAIALIVCQFFGQLSGAEQPIKCTAVVSTKKSYAYQEISMDPFLAHNVLYQRHRAQEIRDPNRPFGFSTEGVMSSQVLQMKNNLTDRLQILTQKNTKNSLLEFAKKAIDHADRTINDSYRYDDLLVLSLWHSMVMTIDPQFGTLFLEDDIARQNSMKNPFNENFLKSHPRFGYLLPVMGMSEKLDLVRSRNAFFYSVGITVRSEFADGGDMSPYQFLIHDWSAHAGRSSSADVAEILYLSAEEIPAFYKRRLEVIGFIDDIFLDQNYSQVLKDNYEDLLYRIDHEDSHSVAIDDMHLRTLLTYFIDQPRATMPKTNPLVYEKAKADWMTIQKHQLQDFQRLFKTSPEFKNFWLDFKKRFKKNAQISEVIRIYEATLTSH